MKKSLLLVWLLGISVCLTACSSKDFNMSFEEALEIANHSERQDILSQNSSFEQSFDISGSFDYEWNKVDANISTNSKQCLDNKNSELSAKINGNISSEWLNAKIDWTLDIKQIEDMLYLNLSSLNLTWDESLWFVSAMVESYKNQWFSLSMTGLSEMPDSFSTFRDSKEMNEKAKEIIINEGSTVYSWKFSQFNGYNAWKISIDNEKLNALIKEYYDTMYNNLNKELPDELSEDSLNEVPEFNIQNFEWYLVITWKDKVTTVIENMEILEEDDYADENDADEDENVVVISANWFAGEDFELYLSTDDEVIISIIAQKKGSKYNVSISAANAAFLEGTISPKLSKSSIDLKYDLKLTIKSQEEWEADIVVPFKGAWKYASITDFITTAPESAQDLNELLWWYDDAMYENNYDYDNNYEDLYNENSDYTLEDAEWDYEIEAE